MEIQKSQLLRLWDVFVLGPVLIYVSGNRKLKPLTRHFLLFEGVTVILYNGVNYLANRRLAQQNKLTPLNFRQELRKT